MDNCTCATPIGTYKVCNICCRSMQVLCASMHRINSNYNKKYVNKKETQAMPKFTSTQQWINFVMERLLDADDEMLNQQRRQFLLHIMRHRFHTEPRRWIK